MNPSFPNPLTSTIEPATFPASPSSDCPPDPSAFNSQHSTSDDEVVGIADAIRNSVPPHRRPHRRRDHFAAFEDRLGPATPFNKDVVNDMYEIIERYGLCDTSAARGFEVSFSTVAHWKQEKPHLHEFFEIARAKFELDQVHKVESSVKKDGQADSSCARWLLERAIPERWGSPAARRYAAQSAAGPTQGRVGVSPAVEGVPPETSSKPKPPKSGTPEFWDTVEEEPLPRKLYKCIITPGRHKFYSTVHMIEMHYVPDVDPANPPPTPPDPNSEQGKAEEKALFHLQETYFALPKEQRLEFLHQHFERKHGKVLTPEERAAADKLVGPMCAREEEDESIPETREFEVSQQSKSAQIRAEIRQRTNPSEVAVEVRGGDPRNNGCGAELGEQMKASLAQPSPLAAESHVAPLNETGVPAEVAAATQPTPGPPESADLQQSKSAQIRAESAPAPSSATPATTPPPAAPAPAAKRKSSYPPPPYPLREFKPARPRPPQASNVPEPVVYRKPAAPSTPTPTPATPAASAPATAPKPTGAPVKMTSASVIRPKPLTPAEIAAFFSDDNLPEPEEDPAADSPGYYC